MAPEVVNKQYLFKKSAEKTFSTESARKKDHARADLCKYRNEAGWCAKRQRQCSAINGVFINQ